MDFAPLFFTGLASIATTFATIYMVWIRPAADSRKELHHAQGELKTKIVALETWKETHDTSTGVLQNDVRALTGQVGEMATSLATLCNEVKNIGKKIKT